jgi:hypothetical protein
VAVVAGTPSRHAKNPSRHGVDKGQRRATAQADKFSPNKPDEDLRTSGAAGATRRLAMQPSAPVAVTSPTAAPAAATAMGTVSGSPTRSRRATVDLGKRTEEDGPIVRPPEPIGASGSGRPRRDTRERDERKRSDGSQGSQLTSAGAAAMVAQATGTAAKNDIRILSGRDVKVRAVVHFLFLSNSATGDYDSSVLCWC